eukprot:8736064-Alexandrium_andersonii.AAC.1
MIRRPPRSTHCISVAASDVYKRQPPKKSASGAARTASAFWGVRGGDSPVSYTHLRAHETSAHL